jgi:hypothetical protein
MTIRDSLQNASNSNRLSRGNGSTNIPDTGVLSGSDDININTLRSSMSPCLQQKGKETGPHGLSWRFEIILGP